MFPASTGIRSEGRRLSDLMGSDSVHSNAKPRNGGEQCDLSAYLEGLVTSKSNCPTLDTSKVWVTAPSENIAFPALPVPTSSPGGLLLNEIPAQAETSPPDVHYVAPVKKPTSTALSITVFTSSDPHSSTPLLVVKIVDDSSSCAPKATMPFVCGYNARDSTACCSWCRETYLAD